jgi:hypothetical protein
LAVECHPENLGVLHGGVDFEDMHGGLLGGAFVVQTNEGQAPRVLGLTVGDRGWYGPVLLPASQAPELRIQGEHVGQRGGAGAGQPVDIDGAADGDVFDLWVLGIPGLDLQAVDKSAPQVTDDRRVGVRVQVAVVFKALEQHREPFTEVSGAEVGVAVLCDGLVQQLVG